MANKDDQKEAPVVVINDYGALSST
ncbi:hypothetical protein CCACVL1_30040 [Corchorus capsularis]|uniref:Uncharacterized protein n=1 Tax=Corchorus capsularis TaxID=210143 RepID=A0A1R3FYY5_COCAP|nr:hypothetical protein CCACVL1_30040 [Corchorus capsularis]